MLPPDARSVAIDLLRPPVGYELDLALLTTYTLDLEALLALPLAVLAHADGGIDELLRDPLMLMEALRRAGIRIHVFVDKRGISVPAVGRDLYTMLERCVHPVSAPAGGVFHPKVWLARFVDADGDIRIRVAVLSRNLTHDRSWDVALTSEGVPSGQRRKSYSLELSDLIRKLPDICEQPLTGDILDSVQKLAHQAGTTTFPSPQGFQGPVQFHALGLGRRKTKLWQPRDSSSNLLAVSPFLGATVLKVLSDAASSMKTLVSRQSELDELSESALNAWDEILVLSETAEGEIDDDDISHLHGLHAKIIAMEHSWDVTWFIGSANLSAAAFTGHNVELMASISAKKSRQGIQRFKEDGFLKLCQQYVRADVSKAEEQARQAMERLEAVRETLLDTDLALNCSRQDSSWVLALVIDSKLILPPHTEVAVWPVTLPESLAGAAVSGANWLVPEAKLTIFLAFRITAMDAHVDDIRMTLKLPATGLPKGRAARVLRSLVDTPERFLRFLRTLLGEFNSGEGLPLSLDGDGKSNGQGERLSDDTLLEDLVRAASRDPDRLIPIRRLIEELRANQDDEQIVPDDLYTLWQVIESTLGEDRGPS